MSLIRNGVIIWHTLYSWILYSLPLPIVLRRLHLIKPKSIYTGQTHKFYQRPWTLFKAKAFYILFLITGQRSKISPPVTTPAIQVPQCLMIIYMDGLTVIKQCARDPAFYRNPVSQPVVTLPVQSPSEPMQSAIFIYYCGHQIVITDSRGLQFNWKTKYFAQLIEKQHWLGKALWDSGDHFDWILFVQFAILHRRFLIHTHQRIRYQCSYGFRFLFLRYDLSHFLLFSKDLHSRCEYILNYRTELSFHWKSKSVWSLLLA